MATLNRQVSEAAVGTGKLVGVAELTNAMQEMDKIAIIGQECFSRMHYSINIHKWYFDNVKDKVVRKQVLRTIIIIIIIIITIVIIIILVIIF